jgi:hypothetical protein
MPARASEFWPGRGFKRFDGEVFNRLAGEGGWELWLGKVF